MGEMQVVKAVGGLTALRYYLKAQATRFKDRLRREAKTPPFGAAEEWGDVVILDYMGVERDYGWLFATYGPVEIMRAEPILYPDGKYRVMRLIGVQDRIGPAALVVTVVNEDSTPFAGMCVARYWPDAPALPETPEGTIRWYEQAVYGFTNDEGNIGFGLGLGDYYWPSDTTIGASAEWALGVYGQGVACDCFRGSGMIGGTDHRHLDLTVQLFVVDPENGGEEIPSEVVPLLTDILGQVKEINGKIDLSWELPQIVVTGTLDVDTKE